MSPPSNSSKPTSPPPTNSSPSPWESNYRKRCRRLFSIGSVDRVTPDETSRSFRSESSRISGRPSVLRASLPPNCANETSPPSWTSQAMEKGFPPNLTCQTAQKRNPPSSTSQAMRKGSPTSCARPKRLKRTGLISNAFVSALRLSKPARTGIPEEWLKSKGLTTDITLELRDLVSALDAERAGVTLSP